MTSRASRDTPPPDDPADRPERAGTTHFGFEEIAEGDKAPRVRGVFESVSNRYDLMNDLMSGGVHRLWKAAMIDWLDPRPGLSLLDVAGGTGDIALRVIERLGPERCGLAVVCDLTPDMLAIGRDRALDRGVLGGIHWVCGNAEALPLPDRCTDAYTIAFGLRNVTRIEPALAEARRVLRPGGRFLCLEFSRVVLPVLARLYDLYSFKVLPAMGELVTGDRDAYRYLVESIRRFPAQDELAAMMRAAGLEQVRYRNLTGGVAALHSAWRL
ncbi:MAG: class I SAM-dependent methyltransferase [Rhodospirillales bacterium]|nr:class I SAM-dependent methyltransferase [Rhodospirillales bacterium]MDH3912834.1 class I SAM-dependent methyltransferase [Rhodospirillales bacterium]MDH3917389.1 class I SAM-dependent methyltransferase [Rhodospirillales bacterium]MDH3965396.1 class I SAM-dependent methyltransferase [Rhodospirillales bacterium]